MILRRLSIAAVLVALAQSASAQTAQFDNQPSGFLSVPAGGMATDAWSGSSLGTAKRLVAALPAASHSRALRDLQFKVMVSQLALPAQDNSGPPSLFSDKVERMAAMGEAESLNELVRSVDGYGDPWVGATVANALMMAGERASACNIVQHNALQQPFGKRAEIACKVVAGDDAGALAAAEANGRDPGIVTLARVAAGSLPPGAAPLSPLDGPAMMVLDLAHVVPPAAALQSAQPPMIRALVGSRTLGMAARIDIAERGEALAIIEATRLGDLYLQAVKEGAVLPPAMAKRAQLVAAVRNSSNAQELMTAITAVYAETRGSALFPTMARATAIGLLHLPAKPEFANVAQEAMRGFLLLGDKQLALAWTKLALTAAYNNARAMIALDRLMPLVVIAGIDNPTHLAPDDVNRWYEVMRQDDPKNAPLRGYLLLQLFRATGLDMPKGETVLPEAPPGNIRLVSPPAATLQALQAAAAAHRHAETALLASLALGDSGLAEFHPAAVAAIVRALRAVGEDSAARLFAIETAIAHGL
jgi:hypothetical protein